MKYLWRVSAIVAAGVLHVLFQAGILFARSDFSWNSFRSYFAGDQLSYMSMVVNTYNGQLSNFEPFTETGVNNYPHLYYVLLGLGARVLGIEPLQAWSAGGLLVQFLLVCFLATVLVVVGGRAWLALLAPLPFILGTFSFLLAANAWFTGLASHAVLWGAFGTMFTLNGEVFSLCLGGAALLLLVLAWSWAKRPWVRIVLASVASLMIGITANVQTYSFLIVVFVAVYVVGAYGIVTARRRWWLALVSLALVGVLFIVGPLIAHDAGPLATLFLGLVPAFPGLIVVAIRSRGLLVLFIGLSVLAAAPQVVGTALGIVNHDPFLTYRVVSSNQLGVGFSGILGSLALLLPLLGILAAGIWRRSALWVAYPVGVLASWVIVSSNDIWGANQEPYRFWLDTFVMVCMTILPFAVMVVRSLLAGPSAEVEESPIAGATADVASGSTAAGVGRPRRRRLVVLSVLGL
ncbi:MAG: hypothetical protein QOE16_2730, partial [Microbacteriaceae bacterium]|nr:hypothetical protein [Microbacteriaceae bacterium]